jgi:hypothetical protein
MKNSIIFLIFLISINFVQAIQIDFNCPKNVNFEEEFLCNLKISDAEGNYDVKIEIVKDGSNIVKIWNEQEQKWKSAFYYLRELISNEETKEIKLKIRSEGDFQGIIKLRQGTKIEYSNFEIIVGETEIVSEENEADTQTDEKEIQIENIIQNKENPSKEEKETIFLNGETIKIPKREVIYESKSQRALNYAPYAFSIFLIAIIGILLQEKF